MRINSPVIGVTPLWDVALESVWMLPDYLDGIREAGGIPVVLPLEADDGALSALADRFDGFLFTGGPDVSPALYGVEDPEGKAKTCLPRDRLETGLLRKAVALDKPVLGICRGLQLINVVLGGTLYLDLPGEHPSELVHRQAKPYDRHTHSVRLTCPLRALLATDNLPVNTLHHQAVRELAPGLEPMAFSPDGLVEAFRNPSARFLWAVQWHPEYLFRHDAPSRRLFQTFVAAAVRKPGRTDGSVC